MIWLVLTCALSSGSFGQSSLKTTKTTKIQIIAPTKTNEVDLPLDRIKLKPPKQSLQNALKIAEAYIEKNKIDISPYYLTQAKLIYADGKKIKETYWWFWWVKPMGALGDYVEIGVSMDGKAWRIPSM